MGKLEESFGDQIKVSVILRIQNLILWNSYKESKEYLCQKYDADINTIEEKELFFMTSTNNIRAINLCKEE